MKTRKWRFGIPLNVISFIYNDNASRTDFIIDKGYPQAVDEIVRFLKAQSGWDAIELPSVWLESGTFKLTVEALKRHGCRHSIKDGLHSPVIMLGPDWDTYFKKRSKRFRHHLRNTLNRINRAKTDLRCVKHISERPDTIQQICGISEKSWKARSKNHLDSRGNDSVFFDELTRSLADQGWLSLWMLDIDARPAAYDYHVLYNGNIYALRSDYDERYAMYSPGTFIHMTVIRKYIEENKGLRKYEFCGHEEEYKTKWTSEIKFHGNITIYRSSFCGALLYAMDYKVAYKCKQLLKKFAILKRLKKLVTRTR